MRIMNIFKKRQYGVLSVSQKQGDDFPVVPDGAWVKCNNCGKL